MEQQEDTSCYSSSPVNTELRPFCPDNPITGGFLLDSSRGKVYKNDSVSSKVLCMSKSGFVGTNVTSSVGKKGGGKGIGTTITVCRTEKDTVVHTDSSNFREVVHKLTGVSSDDRNLLPLMGSTWCAVKRKESVAKSDFTGRSPELGPRKPMPTKLFERRRSSKALDRLSTSCKERPSLVASPVTPLASDFERISLPVTPAASPISSSVMPAPEVGSIQMHLSLSSQHDGNGQWFSSNNESGMSMCANLSQLQNGAGILYSAMSEPSIGVKQDLRSLAGQSDAIAEEQATAEKGFFLHPQRPGTNEPTLLPLFPESPRGN